MAQEKCFTSSQTVLYQITPTVSSTEKTPSLMETEQTPLISTKIVTSPTAPVKQNKQAPQTNPLQTQYLPNVGVGDKPKTKEVPKVGTGDKPKTKEMPKVGMGDKPKINEVPNVETGDKPKTNKVPKVGAGEAPMVSVQESPQRNVKFEKDRKRCSADTDGKNPHENKSTQRHLCF